MNVSIVQQNYPCKIYISVTFNLMNSLLNMAMNVSIAPCKICINVAVNLYELAFKYKDKCMDCAGKPSLQN